MVLSHTHETKDSITIGAVGFSMGAIILANYVATAGATCPLKAAVSVSGSFDPRELMMYRHSSRKWQPLLCHDLKRNFLLPNLGLATRKGVEMRRARNASSIIDFDREIMTVIHGYDDVYHYYRDMGAGCDKQK
jgi:predicted alpha/beta-fold hydrolase